MITLRKRLTAGALVLALTAGPAASASVALGHDLHQGQVDISVGTQISQQIFWSDTYSDLRTEHYLTYVPNSDVLPTVAYGDTVLSRATLSAMAQNLEQSGERVVGGINGDYYAMSTGSPVGVVITDGVIRSTPSVDSTASGSWYWGIGFRSDGSAFIGQPKIAIQAYWGGASHNITGGLNKIRTTTGGYTLLNSDFSATTQNTSPGVDVILSLVTEQVGQSVQRSDGVTLTQSDQPVLNGRLTFVVEQVLESTGSISIPEGKYVLTVNAQAGADWTDPLKALQPGDTVDIDFTSRDSTYDWSQAVEAIGAPSSLVQNGSVNYSSFQGDDNASSRRARTAIGIKDNGSVIFYTLDGGQSGYSVGCTLEQVALRLIELGCVQAVALDGGGSTTIGATYPDQSAMGVVNQPSDGQQRANSTAIFLTTELEPTDELGSYYVTPSSSLVLSGASVQFTATPLDTAYYVMEDAGEGVTYSIQNGDGAITVDGLFTAGGESGSVQVTAVGQGASGTATVTVVNRPDSLSLVDAATSREVTSLNLSPGEQIDLNAQAVYRKLDLYAQDTCFTWSCDAAVGSVDENGVFTAGTESASGTLTVTYQDGVSASIPVSVAGHVNTLESCEEDLSAFTSTATVTVSAEQDLTYVHNGRQSLQLDYNAAETGTASLAVELTPVENESYLGVWIYGDGSGNTLTATVTDHEGETSNMALTALTFTGWKHVVAALPQNTASICTLSVIYGGGENPSSGTLWLDHFTTANENVSDSTAPVIELTLSGNQLTAVITDDVDRSLSGENITVTYDGLEVEQSWNESTGVLSATLSAANGLAHRVTVTAADASGNLARASADVEPDEAHANYFADTVGHWAAKYATYLHDAGVSFGTGEENGVFYYSPDRSITRAEFFALVARWLNLDMAQWSTVELPFADADAIPDWALAEIRAMYGMGILSGSDNGNGLYVNPNANITRAEAMTILGRTLAKGYALPELTAADASQVPDWALSYVQTLVGQGVVSGYNGNLNPNASITRGEVAALLYNML